ncbi:uncharacterized protein LOC128217356 [Mya arenaria]|uniref:uncharacterized protein LOC128217356 n=1 Tax=Mya arenaria TaxID=6604 RepID=UPI0022E8A4AA|nr:uncharacterized protein LOC128217356 [Mya arenaria]
MFEIPDDDDDALWNDDIFDPFLKSSGVDGISEGKENKPLLNMPETFCVNPAKRMCTGTDYNREGNSSSTDKPAISGPSPPQNNNSYMTTQKPNNIATRLATGHSLTPKQAQSRPPGCSLEHVTPIRKRKFPGPAGILPRLSSGQSLDALSPSILPKTTANSGVSPQDDLSVPCSQSSDDVFSDAPWQTLVRDLGDEASRILNKFTIASTLLLAGKKQLPQGKAPLVFGVVESVESHGAEASITIRDKSGRMQGTVHRDLLKEHEAELQIGACLLLKQVSIISVCNRKHYLNLTPPNLVSVYRTEAGELVARHFHGSQDSLCSVLACLEKNAAAEMASLNSSINTGSPLSHTGSSRLSLNGSSTNTPQLFGQPPTTPVLNQLFSTAAVRTPGQSAPIRGQARQAQCQTHQATPGHGQVRPVQNRMYQGTPGRDQQRPGFGQTTPVHLPPQTTSLRGQVQLASGQNTSGLHQSGSDRGQIRPALGQTISFSNKTTPQHASNTSRMDTSRFPQTARLDEQTLGQGQTTGPRSFTFQNRTTPSVSSSTVSTGAESANNKQQHGSKSNLVSNSSAIEEARLSLKLVSSSSCHTTEGSNEDSASYAKESNISMNKDSRDSVKNVVNMLRKTNESSGGTGVLHTNTSTAVSANAKQNTSCNSASKNKWKFKSPPSRNSGVQNSPVAGKSPNNTTHCISPLSSVKTNNLNPIKLQNADPMARTCQLNVNTSVFTQKTMSPIETSQWMFNVKKCTTSNSTCLQNDMAGQSTTGNKSPTQQAKQGNEDPLWGDDLSDEILSQLSEDFI